MQKNEHNQARPKAQPVAALHGLQGEDMACKLLTAFGYTILGRNIRHGRAEMDVLALESGFLVCIEIKTRTNTTHGQPEDFITPKKMALLNQALQEEVYTRQWPGPSRFDEVALVLEPHGWRAHIFRDVQYD
jgi:putative endonuclease